MTYCYEKFDHLAMCKTRIKQKMKIVCDKVRIHLDRTKMKLRDFLKRLKQVLSRPCKSYHVHSQKSLFKYVTYHIRHFHRSCCYADMVCCKGIPGERPQDPRDYKPSLSIRAKWEEHHVSLKLGWILPRWPLLQPQRATKDQKIWLWQAFVWKSHMHTRYLPVSKPYDFYLVFLFVFF